MSSELEDRIKAVQNDPVVKTAVLGQQAEDFLNDPIGSYLLKQSRSDEAEAMEMLKKHDPHDWRGIQALQNRIAVAENFQVWIGIAIREGAQALNQIEESQVK